MVGIPPTCNTAQDWENTTDYLVANGSPQEKAAFIARLQALQAAKYMLQLKAGVTTPPEERTAADYENVVNPNSPLVRSGLTETEIDSMISDLT